MNSGVRDLDLTQMHECMWQTSTANLLSRCRPPSPSAPTPAFNWMFELSIELFTVSTIGNFNKTSN
jgi:hypothetical protein